MHWIKSSPPAPLTQLSSPMGAMSCSPSDAMSSTPKLQVWTSGHGDNGQRGKETVMQAQVWAAIVGTRQVSS
eukprot:365005-Chlamydomonas_euryale.AAC.6